jgi:hypothetical protein
MRPRVGVYHDSHWGGATTPMWPDAQQHGYHVVFCNLVISALRGACTGVLCRF